MKHRAAVAKLVERRVHIQYWVGGLAVVHRYRSFPDFANAWMVA